MEKFNLNKMQKLLSGMVLLIILTQAHIVLGQRYRVEIDLIQASSSECEAGVQSLSISLEGKAGFASNISSYPTRVFDEIFPNKPDISQMQVMPTLTCEYLTGGIALCFMSDVIILNPQEVNMSPGAECLDQGLQVLTTCGGAVKDQEALIELFFSVRWSPIYSIVMGPSQKEYCENEKVTLEATRGYQDYSWVFSENGGSWKPFANPPTNSSSSSITVGLNNIYGNGDNSSKFNVPILFGVYIGSCAIVNTSQSISFMPPAPKVKDVGGFTKTDAVCFGSNGSVSVSDIGRSILSNERVTIQIFARNEPVINNNRATKTIYNVTSLPVSFPDLPAGQYKFFVYSQNFQCGDTSYQLVTDFEITQPTKVVAAVSFVQPSCHTAVTGPKNDGSIVVIPSGGEGMYNYSLNGGTYQTSSSFLGLTANTYNVRVKDTRNCMSDIVSVTITQPPDIIISSAAVTSSYGGSDVRCNGSSDGAITVAASGGTGTLAYSRNGSSFQTDSVLSGLAAGTYTVAVRDGNSCVRNSAPVVLTAPAPVTMGSAITQPSCFGESNGSITLSGSGGTGSFQYSKDGGAFQADSVFENLSANTFTMRIRDANLCTVQQAILVNQPLAVIPSGNATVVTCSGGSDGVVTLSAVNGTAPYTYSFNGSAYAIANRFTNVNASSYTISVKDSKGCTGSDNIIVTSNPPLTALLTPTPVSCNGTSTGALSVTPGGGVGPYTYNWSNGSTTEDISGVGAGSYTLTLTDSKNCSKPFTQLLTQPDPVTVTYATSLYNGVNIRCFGQNNGSVNITTTGGNGGYRYSWSNNTTTEDQAGLTAGTYQVNVLDSKDCPGSASVTLTQPAPLVSSQTLQNILCFGGNTGSITFAASGGTGSYEYSVNNGTNWQPLPAFSNLSAGSYAVLTRDTNNCQAAGIQTLTSPDAITLTLSNLVNTACNQQNGSAIASASGGVAAYSYEWFNSSAQRIGTTANITNLGAGIYQVIVTDQNACTKSESVPISSSNGPTVTSGAIIPATCADTADGSASISVTGGSAPYTIQWPAGQTTLSAVNLAGGTYIVQVKDNANCLALQTITVPAPEALLINTLVKEDPNCFGNSDGAITVGASGGNGTYRYNWNTGAATPALTNLPAGTYTVTVKDLKNCEAAEQIALVNPPVFTVDLGPDQKICEGMNVTLTAAEDNATYAWASANGFTSTNQTVQLTEAGTYTLTVINQNGCEASDSFALIYDTNLLKADFLMTSRAQAGDTVMLIDISWPLPEQTTWRYQAGPTVVEETKDYAMIRYDQAGEYMVSLLAKLAQCINSREQLLVILEAEEPAVQPNNAQAVITKVSAYPNPSPAELSVTVDLNESKTVTLEVYQMASGMRVYSEELRAGTAHLKALNLSLLPRGMYVLRIRAGKEMREIKIVKQ